MVRPPAAFFEWLRTPHHPALVCEYPSQPVCDFGVVRFQLVGPSYDLANDVPQSAAVYGRRKLAGEEAMRPSGAEHLIFRTSWVFAARGKNFFRTVLRLARERKELKFVADQFGAPTWGRLVAKVTAFALQQDLARRPNGGFESGMFHLTASSETS